MDITKHTTPTFWKPNTTVNRDINTLILDIRQARVRMGKFGIDPSQLEIRMSNDVYMPVLRQALRNPHHMYAKGSSENPVKIDGITVLPEFSSSICKSVRICVPSVCHSEIVWGREAINYDNVPSVIPEFNDVIDNSVIWAACN